MGRSYSVAAGQIAERRRRALRLRIAGRDLVSIGRTLAADPAVNSTHQHVPRGYGIRAFILGQPPPTDEQLAAAAEADIQAALATPRLPSIQDAEAMRALNGARLEALLQIALEGAGVGDNGPSYLKAAIAIIDQHSRLYGLPLPPEKASDFDQKVKELLDEMESTAAGLDPARVREELPA